MATHIGEVGDILLRMIDFGMLACAEKKPPRLLQVCSMEKKWIKSAKIKAKMENLFAIFAKKTRGIARAG